MAGKETKSPTKAKATKGKVEKKEKKEKKEKDPNAPKVEPLLGRPGGAGADEGSREGRDEGL